MSDLAKEVEALKARVDVLERKSKERSLIEAEILDAARQWARLTKLGFYINPEGYQVLLTFSDAKDLAESYMRLIRAKSEALLRLDT